VLTEYAKLSLARVGCVLSEIFAKVGSGVPEYRGATRGEIPQAGGAKPQQSRADTVPARSKRSIEYAELGLSRVDCVLGEISAKEAGCQESIPRPQYAVARLGPKGHNDSSPDCHVWGNHVWSLAFLTVQGVTLGCQGSWQDQAGDASGELPARADSDESRDYGGKTCVVAWTQRVRGKSRRTHGSMDY
jgi:hypothetical protein